MLAFVNERGDGLQIKAGIIRRKTATLRMRNRLCEKNKENSISRRNEMNEACNRKND